MSGAYPWILIRPASQRPLPPDKPSRQRVLVCGRCGWEWKGRRKKCPACMTPLDEEACTDAS